MTKPSTPNRTLCLSFPTLNTNLIMSHPITIRKAVESDSKTLVAFNMAMALETEQLHLQKRKVEAGVKELFRNPEHGFYLVAEIEGRIVGSLLITTEWSDWRNGLYWWIQSVYVLPETRRRGVYRTLYRYIQEMAADHPEVCGCRLYVEKDNMAAQRTYTRLGMNESNYKMFEEMFRE